MKSIAKGLIAAICFFTKLPLWRLYSPEKEYYKRVVNYWPYAGIVTGGVAAAVMAGAAFVFPPSVAVILAIAARLLLTGALHEDGLADFADGFGGGTDRQRILAIMKDSHIGSYGVITLAIYFLLLYTLLASVPVKSAAVMIFCADICGKFIAGNIVNMLPYAREEAQSKNKLVYERMPLGVWLCNLVFVAAVLVFFNFYFPQLSLIKAFVAPVILFLLAVFYIKKKLGGYTGDCCGALFLMCELSYLLFIVS